jgi:DEAD/DEAH box helicase domain-containing protein
MNNPIQIFERVRDNFILYLETAFGTRYTDFEIERKELMKRDKVFARAPWVEPLPTYKASDFTVDEITNIPNLNNEEVAIFKTIVKAGLFGENKLYEHQWQMLTQAISGEHCVITSGTGSGKTESFLLPLFAYLSKEMNSWKDTENIVNNTNWWSDKGFGPVKMINDNGSLRNAVKQRPNIKRPAAIRAMLIYPMNALVEDQLSRLRKALDSDDARQVFNDFGNNRIYFGRYNSSSPVSGKLLKDDGTRNDFTIARLKKAVKDIQINIDAVSNYLALNSDNKTDEQKKDLLANFQRLDGGEMRTRFDMQETPPDILITNFSMLSIMLMREIDNPLLEKTKEWLSCETEFDNELSEEQIIAEKKNRIFHIIIDELHLYRGGSGTETAFLIRMLLERLGLTPDSDQLRILASSASLEGDEGRLFLKSFFGTVQKEIRIIEGTQIEPNDQSNMVLDARMFEKFGKKSTEIDREINDIEYSKIDNFINTKIEFDNANLIKLLFDEQGEIIKKLFEAFRNEGRVRAIPAFKNGLHDTSTGIISLAEALFGRDESENDEAVKGFLYGLGLFERFKIETSFPRLRFHLFYRNVGGLWAELKSDAEMQANPNQMPFANLMTTPKLISNNKRTLELLYCENCGAIAFGGNRISVRNENEDSITELLPISADIEGVPETSSATIIEKRKYKDFSVFYPGVFNGEIVQPEYSIPKNARDDFYAEWQEAWINVKSGKIHLTTPNNLADFKKGLFYTVKENNTDIKEINETEKVRSIGALPCLCPQCKSDYSHPMKKKHSPFRGFRTGFGKVSQILSKELFAELPEGENTKKLVAFSDSREDAAKLAKNIEEEHYNSLVREVMIHNITSDLQFDTDVINAIENRNDLEIDQLITKNSERYVEIETIINSARRNIPLYVDKLNLLRENIKPISSFINTIITNLLGLGVNPAGPFKSTERVSQLVNGDNYNYVNWSNAFDFNTCTFRDGFYYRTYNRATRDWERINISDHFNKIIEENLAGFIFGKLFYSLESSGLGYATITNNVQSEADQINIQSNTLKEICNSFLRIWGDTYKHNRSDFPVTIYQNYKELPAGRREKKYIKKVSTLLVIDEAILGDTVFGILARSGHTSQVEINHLNIKLAARSANYYKCSTCGTIHLHYSAGICVFCQNELNNLPEIESVENLLAQNYLTNNLLKNYNPFRLHTEELSGQTDDQLTRQREFKNIFIDQQDKKTKAIDLLSVTTTLEVGVDIGSLQAILLANMPPQRFNYQQRVGRTGRRGQIFSYALTIARGRSHDEFYFENPISITGDKPPQPFLSLGQEQIFKRVFAKAILMYAFKELNVNKGSVHGEFGSIADYINGHQERLIEYLNDNIDSSIRDIFEALNKGIYVDGIILPYIFDNFRQWILELPLEIRTKIDDSSNTNMDLSEFLAENGVLPLQGMPTRVRNLIHGFRKISDNEGYEATTMDRDLGVAIYDYAPGSQKTKDKGVVQSIGFTPDITEIKYRQDTQSMEAETMQRDAFTNRIWMKQNNDTLQLQTKIYDNENSQEDFGKPDAEDGFTIFLGATPAAFRTDLKYPKDSNDDFDINFSKPITFAVGEPSPPNQIRNAIIKYSGQEKTWKINNNGKKQFEGKYYKDEKHGANLPRQWLCNDFGQGFTPAPNDEQNFLNGSTFETLSIVSGKVTEVFRLQPRNLPLTIQVDPFCANKFNGSSSKGAFYSAAFLLQRTLAAKLDIDPEEVEIAAIESIELPENEGITGRRSASIVLTDELPNGSGFVKRLYSQFDYYLRRCINPLNNVEEKYNYNILQNRECKDASYQDLKNYRNMSFHPLLDWRLGVGLLRLLADENYTSGLKEEDYLHSELLDWKGFAIDLQEQFAKSFSDKLEPITFGKLPGFTFFRDYKVIIVHPFWNTSIHQPEETILTEAIAEAGIENIYFIDTFNLHRRPSWCYEQLINKIQENQ